jgi:hypothetical protein
MAEKEKKTNAREYHVLQESESDVFVIASIIEASSGDQAIRLVAGGRGPGRYVAVPTRSWTEHKIRFESREPQMIFDDAAGDGLEPTQVQQPEPLQSQPEVEEEPTSRAELRKAGTL